MLFCPESDAAADPTDARHVSGEHHATLPRAPSDREVRLRVELRVNLDEVHAERDERVHSNARLGSVAGEQVRDRHVATLEVRARRDYPWADELAAGDLRRATS